EMMLLKKMVYATKWNVLLALTYLVTNASKKISNCPLLGQQQQKKEPTVKLILLNLVGFFYFIL
ncbi:hypothetical protein ACOL23_11830, partial [Aliarcobacter butzleri]